LPPRHQPGGRLSPARIISAVLQADQAWSRGHPPFGGYCPRRHADQYGARQPVLTPTDARERLSLFFSIDPARIRRLEERRHVFLAEITDPEGRPTELVIIDRRTGRIRSIR